MNWKYILQNLGSLGDFCLLDSYERNEKFDVFQIDSLNYGLLIYTAGACRISFMKLSLKELIRNDDLDLNPCDDSTDKEVFTICLLNVLCLPFTLFGVICTSKNVWAVGHEAVVDLKPYIKQALEKAKSDENDDNMDVDDIEEFHPGMFDIEVKVHKFEIYDLHFDDIFIGCSFIDYGLICCQKNSELCKWDLQLLLSKDKDILSSDVMTLSVLDFPISFHKSNINIASDEGQQETCNPLVYFIHHSDPESHMLRNLFGIDCLSPNAVCLIGHPDGKLLWSLCDTNKEFCSSLKLQTLFDVKQPIVGIFFVNDIEAFEGCGCMLVVGALGQLTLISPKKLPSFTFKPGNNPFWTLTTHLKSSVTNCVFEKDCLLHFSSDGSLWITSLPMLLNPDQKVQEFSLASNLSEFCCIEQMIVADRNQGLIILKTNSGNLYLTQLKKEVDPEAVISSLPSLMNDCLKLSSEMQELVNKKVLQSRLFTAVSAFASLKFSESILEEPITFSISEVNLDPRKYMLIISLKCLEKLHLDSELCYVTATVFTYFKNNNTLLNKTALYNSGEPTLCLELTDTVLQPPFVSIFPLFVEVGLILQLPDHWKDIDCFKTVSTCLPFYVRLQTFMVHELNLLQSNAVCSPASLKSETPKTMKIIRDLGIQRPVSNILQVKDKKNYHLPKKFNLCLSVSSVEEMMKNTNDSDPCKYIEKLLSGNTLTDNAVKESYLTSKSSPMSLNIAKNNNHIVITLTASSFNSLIGLRIAVMDILLATHNQSKHLTDSSSYVNIPASIYRKCEAISQLLMSLYGKDVKSDEVTQNIVQLYQQLRTDVSAKLPIF